MQHAAVLHAGACADTDAVHVTANHGQRPDRAVSTDFDIAKDNGRMIDKARSPSVGVWFWNVRIATIGSFFGADSCGPRRL